MSATRPRPPAATVPPARPPRGPGAPHRDPAVPPRGPGATRQGRPGLWRAARLRWVVPGLLLVAGVALGAAGFLVMLAARPPAPAVRTVVVTMHHTHFQPAEIRVDAGTAVRFVLRNTDPIDHEFIVGDQAVQQRHRVGREAHHDGQVPGEISVPSGTVAVTTVRFDHPGQVAYICHLPGHEAYGMVGVVDVR